MSATSRERELPVLVGVDGSVNNASAVLWAAAEASSSRSALTLMSATGTPGPIGPHHTHPTTSIALQSAAVAHNGVGDGSNGPDPAAGAARSRLDQAALRVARHWPRLPVHTRIRSGPAGDALIAEAACSAMLVVGRRGSGGYSRTGLGSTSFVAAGLAPGIVVTVPEQWADHREKQTADRAGRTASDTVVVGMEPWCTPRAVLRAAASWADRDGCRLHVVAGWQIEPGLVTGEFGIRQTWREIDEAVSYEVAGEVAVMRAEYPDLLITTQVTHGHPAGLLLDVLDSAGDHPGPDTVEVSTPLNPVLAVVGRGGRPGLGLGATAHNVVQEARCPVAVIGTPVGGPGEPGGLSGQVPVCSGLTAAQPVD